MENKKVDWALGMKPFEKTRSDSLSGFEVQEIWNSPIQNYTSIVFHDPLRKLNRDIVFNGLNVYISDYYGDTVDRSEIFYVKV